MRVFKWDFSEGSRAEVPVCDYEIVSASTWYVSVENLLKFIFLNFQPKKNMAQKESIELVFQTIFIILWKKW